MRGAYGLRNTKQRILIEPHNATNQCYKIYRVCTKLVWVTISSMLLTALNSKFSKTTNPGIKSGVIDLVCFNHRFRCVKIYYESTLSQLPTKISVRIFYTYKDIIDIAVHWVQPTAIPTYNIGTGYNFHMKEFRETFTRR